MHNPSNYKYISSEEDPLAFNALLDKFCSDNRLPYQYRSGYNVYRKLAADNLISDKSFLVLDYSDQINGCCFNYIEKSPDGILQMSLNNGYIPSPWGVTSKITRLLYENQNEIAQKFNCSLIKLSHTSKLGLDYPRWNPLFEHGFVDSSDLEITVDLRKSIDLIWTEMRQNHKRIIKKIQTNNQLNFQWVTSNNLDYQLHKTYVQLHHECSGRITRNIESFAFQYDLIKRGEAMLLVAFHESKVVGAIYLMLGNYEAVYASGVDDPTFKIFPIYHSMLWECIRQAKDMGFDEISFGQPSAFNFVPSFNNLNTQKQLNIAHFKRGFGGEIRPSFMGVKYLCKDQFKKDVERFSIRSTELIIENKEYFFSCLVLVITKNLLRIKP